MRTLARSYTGLCSSAVGKSTQNPAESLQHTVEAAVERGLECI